MARRLPFVAIAFVCCADITASANASDSSKLNAFDSKAALREAKMRNIPATDWKGWIEYKRLEFAGKQDGTWEKPASEKSVVARSSGACSNGDFESGSFAGWQAFTGGNVTGTGVVLNPSPPLAGRHTLVGGGGFDPVVGGTILRRVYEGSYSVRLGDTLGGGRAQALTYTFTVTNQTKNFTFSYAIVLEDAGHPAADQPFFRYVIKNSAGAVIKSVKRVADQNDPYFTSFTSVTFGTKIDYRNWDCETVDLSAYVGQVVTITFVTAGCTLSGHFGYAYIDGLCAEDLTLSFTMPGVVCSTLAPITADATATSNETGYFWSIEESDANGGRNPATEVSQWFSGPAGVIDLRNFYAKFGKSFKCDTYYRIKLAVKNSCVPWRETVKLLYQSCTPPFDMYAGVVCCRSTYPVQLGHAPIGGETYLWGSTPPGFTSSIANPVANPQVPTIYWLTTTNAFGCSSVTQMTLGCAGAGGLNMDLSTGVTNGVKDPPGAIDQRWHIRAIPGSIYAPLMAPFAYSVKPNTRIFNWTSSTHANWISPKVNADGTVPSQVATLNNNSWPPNPAGVEYFYQLRFFVDTDQFSNLRIEILDVAADNTAEIYLNSQVMSGNGNNYTSLGIYDLHQISNFQQLHGPFQITTGFVKGLNTLLVRVRNGGGDPPGSVTGLLLHARLVGACK